MRVVFKFTSKIIILIKITSLLWLNVEVKKKFSNFVLMIVLVLKYLLPKGFRGISLFPFIVFSDKAAKNNLVLLNHEKIHIRQQLEMLVIPFYVWYALEFIVRYFQYKNWDLAYRNISFEREAYTNEKDLNYLKQRSFWEFYKFL